MAITGFKREKIKNKRLREYEKEKEGEFMMGKCGLQLYLRLHYRRMQTR